ncbi:MAG: ABC-type transport system involved in Fe-S cluster assembly fused permease/ATPase subunit [Limisphaerales bacterium]|jgi:ABC-type transport system involved in Fe-S cluster assembly fused permease/ATPase subunit
MPVVAKETDQRVLFGLLAVNDIRVLKSLIPSLLEFRYRVVVSMVLLISTTAASLVVPYLLKYIVDDLDTKHVDVLVLPLILLISYGVVRFSLTMLAELREAIFGTVTVRAMRRISMKVLSHLHTLDLEYHLSRRTGAISRDLDRGVNGVTSLMRILVFNIFPTFLQIGGITVLLLVNYDVAFAIIVAIAAVFYVFFTVWITEWRTKFIRLSNDANSSANTRAVDSLINFETVKYFGNEELEQEAYDEDLTTWEMWRSKNRYSLALLNCGQAFFVSCGMVGMMILAAQQVVDGTMTLGDLVLINAFAIQVFAPLSALGSLYRQLKHSLTDVERMVGILDTEPQVTDAADAVLLPPGDARIEFAHVNFGYHEARVILHDISFIVEPGQKVALVGPSGAGKSTIARLLYRFYDVSSGTLSINGVDVRQIQQESLRAQIGVVPQDTVLFNNTLHHNIKYGRPDANDDEVIEAARLAHLDHFITQLPEGYETFVGERGLKLSGGEKQRVAIARAILKQPAFMLFDEATSSLDSNSEQAILMALEEVSQNRTTVVIAHRLSTVIDADLIIVLDEGRIVERGDHETLLEIDGLYSELWNHQQREVSRGLS